MKLRPYPQYKESGVPWLGSIPAHWETTKLKRVSQVQSGVTLGKSYNNSPLTEYPYLRVANVQNGFLNLKHVKTMAVPENEVTSSRLLPGDVVVTEGGDIDKLGRGAIWNGEIENCLHQNHIFAIRPTKNRLSPSFLARTLESHHGRSYFYLTAKRTTNLAATNQTTLGLLPLFLPTVDEQTQIARFLDWKATQINKFIRNKRRLIELLKEQKQNVINQAVTRGLNPRVKLKPSGVEWIGDIPEHWKATKLKRVVSFNPSKSETRANPADEEKVVFLPMENISVNGDIDCSEKRTLSEVWNGFTYFRRGDVVVAKITPCFENGKGAYLKGLESNFGFGTTELIVLRPSKAIDGVFLRFLTSNKQFLLLGEQYMTGAAGQQRIPSDFVKNHPIGLPPIDEQLEILEHIQEKSTEIDQAITRAQREIELMREYRARLISDVVTGQVDVRGIEVPEIAEEELLALEEDTAETDDVIDDEGEMDDTD